MANIPPQDLPSSNPPPLGNDSGDSAATYEQLLSRDLRWALTEGSLFFEGGGRVQETLRRIAARLDELGIDYAVAGGMALFAHGFRRFTEDVDILVTLDSLKRLHEALDGRGYLRPFERSKNLRDAETKVKIEFLITNQFPGDGKPKAISFPDPSQVFELLDGIKVLNLPTLLTLKLASGLSGGPDRAKDLADVGELIKTLRLPESFAAMLHPDVQSKFAEIWRGIYGTPKRYVMYWRNTAGSNAAAEELERMRADGVRLDAAGSTDDYALLVTTDRKIAEKYGFEDESEIFPDDASGNDTPNNATGG
jgi:hypothetical protein